MVTSIFDRIFRCWHIRRLLNRSSDTRRPVLEVKSVFLKFVFSTSWLMQLVREVRADLPVILCSGYSDMLAKDSEHQSNLSSVMRKPFTAVEMSRIIEEALSAWT